jgi:hypothetical protein
VSGDSNGNTFGGCAMIPVWAIAALAAAAAAAVAAGAAAVAPLLLTN